MKGLVCTGNSPFSYNWHSHDIVTGHLPKLRPYNVNNFCVNIRNLCIFAVMKTEKQIAAAAAAFAERWQGRGYEYTKEMQVSMKAGEIVGRIYDALLKQYDDNSPEALRWLNILCVRIVFCLYAEDAGVFRHDQFHDFLARCDADDMRRALNDLFEVLNTPLEKRSKYLKDDLKRPYKNFL